MIHGLYILLLISQACFAKLHIHHPPALLRFPPEAAEEKSLSCPPGQGPSAGDSQGLGLRHCLGDGLAAIPGIPAPGKGRSSLGEVVFPIPHKLMGREGEFTSSPCPAHPTPHPTPTELNLKNFLLPKQSSELSFQLGHSPNFRFLRIFHHSLFLSLIPVLCQGMSE